MVRSASRGSEGSGPGEVGPLASSGASLAFPTDLAAFVDTWERREYWAAHEVLEDAWRETGSPFYQGLILLASAWVHAARGNPHGIDAQLRKALVRLEGLPSPYLGLDVETVRRTARWLRGWVARLRAEAPGQGREGDAAWWRHRIPHMTLRLTPAEVRGDESELSGEGPRS